MAENTSTEFRTVEIDLGPAADAGDSGRGRFGGFRTGPSGEEAFTRVLLYLLALVVVLATVSGSMIFYRAALLGKMAHNEALQLSLLAGLFGVVLAAVLLALAGLLGVGLRQTRTLRGIHNSLDRLRGRVDEAHRDLAGRVALLDESLRNAPTPSDGGRTELSGAPVNTAGAELVDSAAGRQMVELLAQLREVTLMNDQQRQAVADAYWKKKKARLADAISQHIQRREWRRAAERIDEMLSVDSQDPTAREFQQRVSDERRAEVEQVVREAKNQLGEWISIGEWDKVRELLQSLSGHYADEPAVITLVELVRKEEHAARIDELQRLFATLKEATEHRQWQRASICARQLIARYPEEKLVEQIRSNLPMLERNARIQECKEDEAMFQDLLHRQRFEEALEVANRMVEKFPESPAAAELTNRMIPKVRELARQDRLKRQQTAGKPT